MDQVWTETSPRKQAVSQKSAPGLNIFGNNVFSRPGGKTRTIGASPAFAATQQPTSLAPNSTLAGGGYVQIGAFGVPANAASTAQRLQSLGLPVRTKNIKSAGKPLTVVMAGPFAAATAQNRALILARGAGFKDAFLRR